MQGTVDLGDVPVHEPAEDAKCPDEKAPTLDLSRETTGGGELAAALYHSRRIAASKWNSNMYTIEVVDKSGRAIRHRCVFHEVKNGDLLVYDRGLIAGYTAGEWLSVTVVDPES